MYDKLHIINELDQNFNNFRNDLKLDDNLKSSFITWLGEKGVFFDSIQVAWNESDYDVNIEARYGYCHANTLMVHQKLNYSFYSGFVRQNNSTQSVITHSFNVWNNRVFDFTYFKNKDRFLGQNTFPFQYLGVEIPVTFLKEFISLYYSFKSSDRFYPLVSAYFAYEKALKWKLY